MVRFKPRVRCSAWKPSSAPKPMRTPISLLSAADNSRSGSFHAPACGHDSHASHHEFGPSTNSVSGPPVMASGWRLTSSLSNAARLASITAA